MTAPAVTAWAIKAPDGDFWNSTWYETEGLAESQIPIDLWTLERLRGYRCVKVQITEMGEGK